MQTSPPKTPDKIFIFEKDENRPKSHAGDTYTYDVWDQLSTSFKVIGGRLVIVAVQPVGTVSLPVEAVQHLFLEQGKARLRIDYLDQLQGKVRITTPEGALAFVRLPTSLATSYLVAARDQLWGHDIIDRSKLDAYDLYGKNMSWLKNAYLNDGNYGILSHKTYQELKIPDAVSQRVLGGFHIERPVVSQRGFSFQVRKLLQNVSADGKVIDLGTVDLGRQAATSVRWSFPMFM